MSFLILKSNAGKVFSPVLLKYKTMKKNHDIISKFQNLYGYSEVDPTKQ